MFRTRPTLLIALILGEPATVIAGDELPASLIRIPETVTSLFISETSTSSFHRFDRSSGTVEHSGSFYMSIGRQGPGKERPGDRRTPLGVYFVTEQIDTTKLHDKYGVTAFPLDYPNAWDLRADRGGDGIWVHGIDPDGSKRRERDTDGCIALPNEDLTLLAAEFRNNVTPVLVMREVNWVSKGSNAALRAELENSVAQWAASKATGDLYSYLSLYDEDFVRWGMDKTEWSSFSLQTESLRGIRQVKVRNLLLVGYPEEQDVYLSRFQQQVTAEEREIVSTTRLYWRRDTNGVLKIIAEDDG